MLPRSRRSARREALDQNHRRYVVITGASSGIGRATAMRLAAAGWNVIGQGRDPARCNAALADISGAATPHARVAMLQCDLSVLSATAQLADEIARLTPRVDVLLNNAGGIRDRMHITDEGNETTFAGNHLGHFLLTKRLMPLLRNAARTSEAGSVRVISTSSLGHEMCPEIDWSDLQQTQNWHSSRSYCHAKLCNMLFTLGLADRAAKDGIIAHAMHPGVVDSNFHAHATRDMQRHMRERPGDTPDKSAATMTWLAADPGVGATTGRYFHDLALATPSAAALDHDAAARLWFESENLLARSGY